MKNSIRKNILLTKPYVPGKPIEEVQRELGLKRVIKLASNENCLGPSPKALQAIKAALGKINRYPDAANYYVKKRMAAFLKVPAENLIFGNGSDEIICLAIKTFVEYGDEVIIAKPTFLIYEIASQLQNAVMKFVPLRSDLSYDLAAMKKAVTKKTKMIFIANPDNPSGSHVNKAELDRFFKGLPKHVFVFLDEAYFEFARDAFRDYPDGLSYLKNPRVIVSRSFSKAYGLAGLRLGYAVADSEAIGYMDRAREPFNVNLLAQVAAIAALDDNAFLKKTLAHVRREKKFLYSELKNMGLRYVESATNFMLIDVKEDCKEVFFRLLKEGIIVRDMKAWGFNSYIRVTVGTHTENVLFIKALRKVLKTVKY